MTKCILTVGVSASGKTTFAEDFVKEMASRGERWININRDDVRKEFYKMKTGRTDFSWANWNRKWERPARSVWMNLVSDTLRDPNADGIVFSDTNLVKKTREWIEDECREAGHEPELMLFPISFEEAVKRDNNRSATVGYSVIANQMKLYWEQFGKRYTADTALPKAVIVDVDGTLAHMGNRSPYNTSDVHLDTPDEMVVTVVKGLAEMGTKIVVLSGRTDECEKMTRQWLFEHLGFYPDGLFMRATGDTRKDTVVKEELFFNDVAPKYNVIGAIDDRPNVVRMWNSLGLRVLACGFQAAEF
jgi:predicted kinase